MVKNILPLVPGLLFVILTALKIELSLRFDTVLMIVGNFAIAFYIASQINKRLKNEELRINNCFKELEFLQTLLSEIRKNVLCGDEQTKDDDIIRLMSLISLQIELIKKYDFIEQKYKQKLFDTYYVLDANITGNNTIDEQYKKSLLQLEKEILNIKSSIL